MTLLGILIGLALEYFIGGFEQIRKFDWFDKYSHWLELKCNRHAFWDGPVGVLMTLAIPLVLLIVLISVLNQIFITLGFLFAVFIFIYSLDTETGRLLQSYIEAYESDKEDSISEIREQLIDSEQMDEEDETVLLKSLFVQSHHRIFGTIFWFIVLGAVGALLFNLVNRMTARFHDIHGGYAEAIRHLHGILIWPSARLLAIGFALGGSLVDALEAWREVKGHTFDNSEMLIGNSGLGAIQYQRYEIENEEEERDISLNYLQEVQALINRTLIVWLTLLGLLTLGGWLG